MDKASDDRLRDAKKMEALGRLARSVAHDFNNILAAILGTADLLVLRLDQPEAQRDALEIRKAAERGVALTRQVLAFSRREPEILDVNAIVSGSGGFFEDLTGPAVRLHVHPSETPARVRMDAGQLEQLLLQLVANAREAMPQGGTVDIAIGTFALDEAAAERTTALAPGHYVRIVVRDTGTGIDPAVQARVFEPFVTTKDPAQHGGLGLSIVASIVRDARGLVTFSTTPGRGTSVEVTLPAA
jgi:two-component system, cell cycle sensor histidine kinase and response regulator CckA